MDMMQLTRAALVIGFNELARRATVLGEKVFYRFLRDNAEREFLDAGGTRFIEQPSEVILTLGSMPHQVQFRDADIELMRQAVAEHDAKK